MSDIEEPPTKMSKYEMAESQTFTQYEEFEDGQEEWLSEEMLTDDDDGNPPTEHEFSDSALGNTSQMSVSQDNTNATSLDSSTKVEDSNIEQTLNNMNSHEQEELQEDLDTLLIRKTDVKVPDPKPAEESSGNDTDDLLRMLEDDGKTKKVKKITKTYAGPKESKRAPPPASSDDDHDDFDVFEGETIKKMVAKSVVMRKMPATRAVPEDSSDESDASSNEVLTMKKMFGRCRGGNLAAKSTSKPQGAQKLVKVTDNTARRVSLRERRSITSTSTPLKSTSTPLKSTLTPLKSTSTPLKSTSTPLKSTSTPLKSTFMPLKSTSTSLKTISTPLKSTLTPLKSTSKPLKPTSPPLKQYTRSQNKSLLKPDENGAPITKAAAKSSPVHKPVAKSIEKPVARPVRQVNKNVKKVVVPIHIKEEEEHDEIINEEEFMEEDDFEVDEDFVTERDLEPGRQRLMEPEQFDEEMLSEDESLSEDGSFYDELPSSDSEELDDWFNLDIRTERAGDYLPLLGTKAYELLLAEKKRVSARLNTLQESLASLSDNGRVQSSKLKAATAKLAEVDDLLKMS